MFELINVLQKFYLVVTGGESRLIFVGNLCEEGRGVDYSVFELRFGCAAHGRAEAYNLFIVEHHLFEAVDGFGLRTGLERCVEQEHFAVRFGAFFGKIEATA